LAKLRNILIVDDDEIANFISSELIKPLEISESVTMALGGQEALDYLKNAYNGNPQNIIPELIFLDMNMPGIDGLTFLKKIKPIISQSSQLPVIILLSASFLKNQVSNAKSISPIVKGYLEKPLTAETVMNIYNTYFKDRN